jgi:hypothetical protein
VAAVILIASALDLTVDDAIVLHNSNKLTLRVQLREKPDAAVRYRDM